ncbi:unnamed protein product [Heterobilharzia americana]|nr:unnamed protein product [Heterobilharzia americana]
MINDVSSECDSIDEENRITRRSSESSNYIILPTINMLKPNSELPTIPLNKLMSNAGVMDDYFAQYKITSKQFPIESDEIDWSTEKLIESKNIQSIHSPNDLKVYNNLKHLKTSTYPRFDDKNELNKGLIRRRTLPGFLTQPPVDLNRYANLPVLQENGITSGKNSYNLDYDQSKSIHDSWNSQGDNSRHKLSNFDENHINVDHENVSNYPLSHDTSIIYLVENGIRKRARAYNSNSPHGYSPSTPSPPFSISETKAFSGEMSTSSKPITTFPMQSDSSHRLDNSSMMNKDIKTSLGNKVVCKPSSLRVNQQKRSPQRYTQSPLVVANVLLEDPQDQLPQLPTYFKESQLDLCQVVRKIEEPNILLVNKMGS